MPRNGTGTYVLPAGQPVVPGTTISSSVFNTFTNDVATALTNSISTDGQTPMAANLPMGGNKLTGLAAGSAIGDGVNIGQLSTGGAAIIGGGGQYVNSITELRTLNKTAASKFAITSGYYTAGDGGGAVYWYDSSDTTSADNGGTIIVASDGGRWKLFQSDTIYLKQFGVKFDNSSASAAANNSAMQTAINASAGKTLVGAAGTAYITSLTGISNMRLIGAGRDLTIFKRKDSEGTNNALFSFTSKSNCYLEDLTIDGNKANQATGANNVLFSACEAVIVRGCRIRDAMATAGYGVGILLTDGTNAASGKQSRVINNVIDGCGDAGVYASKESYLYISENFMKGNNDGVIVINYVFPPVQYVQNYIEVTKNVFLQNTKTGVRFVGGYTGGTSSAPFISPLSPPCKGVLIEGNTARENGQYGIVYQGQYGAINGNYVARNGTTIDDGGILLSAWDSVCNNNVVEDNAAYGIDCGGSFNTTFNGNIIAYQGNTSGFQATGLNIGGSVFCQAIGNNFESNGGSGSASIYASGFEFGGGYLENVGSNLLLANNTIKLGNTNAIGIYTNHGMDKVQLLGNQVFGGAANRAYILEGGLNDFTLLERNNLDWSNGDVLPSVTSATTMVIPDVGEDFLVTGTTGITTIRTFSDNVYNGRVRFVQISNGGSGYNPASPPGVNFSGGGGSGAAGTALVANSGKIIGVLMTNNGSGYTSAPAVSFTSGSAAGVARLGCDNFKARQITLRFAGGATTVTQGSNLALNGNYTSSAGGGGILVLRGAFGTWYEVSRRV